MQQYKPQRAIYAWDGFMTSTALWPILASLLATFGTCLLLVWTQRWHGKLSLDHDLSGIQKIHTHPVPRIGGIGVVSGLALAGLLSFLFGGETYETAGKLLLCAIPVFGAGLIEDFTKKVGVKTRLIAAFISAALAFFALDAQLLRADIPGIDYLLGFGLFSFLFTCFCVGGLTNAFNIIDGVNGLASGSAAIILLGLGALAYSTGDTLVLKLCLWGAAAAIGFLIVNYPFGKIFLGDGGAYLAGFWVAECCVLLLYRNPEISTWAPTLCAMYPAWETIYSMYRRKVKERIATGQPDLGHFHHLVLKKVRASLGADIPTWIQHGRASAYIWLFVGVTQIAAWAVRTNHGLAACAFGIFAFAYIRLYIRLNGKDQRPLRNPFSISGSKERLLGVSASFKPNNLPDS